MAISGVKEILTVETEENEIALGNRSDEIDVRKENKEMRQIVSELKRTIRKTPGLTSLSAPAIGYYKRIFCIKFDADDIRAFVNPIISQAKGISLSKETCSSIPGKTFIRPRSNDITVMYMTPLGLIETRQLVGMAACVFQHEIDHLDGLLISDIGFEVDEEYEKASDEEKQQVVEAYLESLDIKQKKLQEEINGDPELKELDEGIKFMESVYKGETKLAPIVKEEDGDSKEE